MGQEKTSTKGNGWKTWVIGALFAIVMAACGYIVKSTAGDIDNLQLEDSKQNDSMDAMNKRLSERDYGIDIKLTRLEVRSQADSATLSEIRANQKEILKILGELR